MSHRLCPVAIIAVVATACVVTTDENLWKTGRDCRPTELRSREAAERDAAAERRADRASDRIPDRPGAEPDRGLDAKQPKPDGLCGQMVLAVSKPEDDGWILGDRLGTDGYPDDNLIWMGAWYDIPQWGYFRFTLSGELPQTASINDAKLTLWGEGTEEWGPAYALEIFLEDSGDAAAVSTAEQAPFVPGGRPVTSMVRWPSSGGLTWAVGQHNTSPNLAALLQGLISGKGGLPSGKHLQLWVRGAQTLEGDVATPDFSAPGYSSHPATLTIGWCL